jgi:uncharacterized protein
MIGIGGWGNRNEKNGPYLYYDQAGKLTRDTQAGSAGTHGAQAEFLITLRNTKHPITRGMPAKYGKGRVFHTTLGHVDYSVECVGFITCLQRGAQWAATGKVDIPIPKDFPTETAVSQRKFVVKEQQN